MPPLRMTKRKYSVRLSTHAAHPAGITAPPGDHDYGAVFGRWKFFASVPRVAAVLLLLSSSSSSAQRNNRRRRTNDGGLRALSRSGIWIVPRGSSPSTLLFPSQSKAKRIFRGPLSLTTSKNTLDVTRTAAMHNAVRCNTVPYSTVSGIGPVQTQAERGNPQGKACILPGAYALSSGFECQSCIRWPGQEDAGDQESCLLWALGSLGCSDGRSGAPGAQWYNIRRWHNDLQCSTPVWSTVNCCAPTQHLGAICGGGR